MQAPQLGSTDSKPGQAGHGSHVTAMRMLRSISHLRLRITRNVRENGRLAALGVSLASAADTLVMYTYSNSDPEYERNLHFFVKHGMSEGDGCDYVIIVQEACGPLAWPQNFVALTALIASQSAVHAAGRQAVWVQPAATAATKRTIYFPRKPVLRLGHLWLGDHGAQAGHFAICLHHLHEQLRAGALPASLLAGAGPLAPRWGARHAASM